MRFASAAKLFALLACAFLVSSAIAAQQVLTATFVSNSSADSFNAVLTFTPPADGATSTAVTYKATVTANAAFDRLFPNGFNAYIHEMSTLASGATGSGASGCGVDVTGPFWNPTFQDADSTQAVGNLARHGPIMIDGITASDLYLSLSGSTGIAGRSIILADANSPDHPVLCATITAETSLYPMELFEADLTDAKEFGIASVTINPRIAQPELSDESYFLAQFNVAENTQFVGKDFFFGKSACPDAGATITEFAKLTTTPVFTAKAGDNNIFVSIGLKQVVYYGERSIFTILGGDTFKIACYNLDPATGLPTGRRMFDKKSVEATFTGTDLIGTVTFTPLSEAVTMITTNISLINADYYGDNVEWDIYENGAFTSTSCSNAGALWSSAKNGLYARHGTLRVGLNYLIDRKATNPYDADSYLGRPLVTTVKPAGADKTYVSCPRILDTTDPRTSKFASASFSDATMNVGFYVAPRISQAPMTDLSLFETKFSVNPESPLIGSNLYIGDAPCSSSAIKAIGNKLNANTLAAGEYTISTMIAQSVVDLAGRSLVFIADGKSPVCADWANADGIATTTYDNNAEKHVVTLDNAYVKGTITFQQVANTIVKITTSIKALNASEFPNGALWHIHEFGGVTDQVACGPGVTGNHWDPTFKGQSSADEVGNLSGRFGKLILSSNGGSVSYLDNNLIQNVYGARGIVGRSIVVHKSDAAASNPRRACSDIVPGFDVTPKSTSVLVPKDFSITTTDNTCNSTATIWTPRITTIPGATTSVLQFDFDFATCPGMIGNSLFIGRTKCNTGAAKTVAPENFLNGPIFRFQTLATSNKFIDLGFVPDVALQGRSMYITKDDGTLVHCNDLIRLDGKETAREFTGDAVATGIATGVVSMQKVENGVLVSSNVFPGYTDIVADSTNVVFDVTAAIITNAIPADKSCNFDTDLTLFNPTQASKDADIVGNFYARHGLYEKNAEQSRFRSFVDSKIELSGESSVVGKTFVLYIVQYGKKVVLTCAPIGTMNDRAVLSYQSADVTGSIVLSSYVSLVSRRPRTFVGRSLYTGSDGTAGTVSFLRYNTGDGECTATTPVDVFNPFDGVSGQQSVFATQSASVSTASTSLDYDVKALYGRTAYFRPSTVSPQHTTQCKTIQPSGAAAVDVLPKANLLSARSRVYVTSADINGKITIDLQFDQRTSSSDVNVFLGISGNLTLLGAADSTGLAWHVHSVGAATSAATPPLAVCSAIGSHYNPTFVVGAGVNEFGDLASRLGNLKQVLSQSTDMTKGFIAVHYVDSKISLKPEEINIVARSIAIHNLAPTTGFFGCGTIRPGYDGESTDTTVSRMVTITAPTYSEQALTVFLTDANVAPYRPNIIYNVSVVNNINTDETVSFGFHKYSVAANSLGDTCNVAIAGPRAASNGDLFKLVGIADGKKVGSGVTVLQEAAVVPANTLASVNALNGMSLVLSVAGNPKLAQCGPVYLDNNPLPNPPVERAGHLFLITFKDLLASSGASKEEHLGSKMLDKLVGHLTTKGSANFTGFKIVRQLIYHDGDAPKNAGVVNTMARSNVRESESDVYVEVTATGIAANEDVSSSDAEALAKSLESDNYQNVLSSKRYSLESVSSSGSSTISALCEDGVLDNGETDVDCGNTEESTCAACKPGQKCNKDSHCTTNICTKNLCASGPDNSAATATVSVLFAAVLMMLAVLFA